jgi:hypothetical protein
MKYWTTTKSMDDNAEEIKVRFFRYFFSNILKPVSLDELC